MAQRGQWHLWSTGTQVGSPAGPGGVRGGYCCSLGGSFGLDVIPGLGTPYDSGWPKKRKKKSMRMDLSDTCKGRTAGIGWLLGCWGVKSGEADDTEILSSAVCEDGEAFTGARGRGVGGEREDWDWQNGNLVPKY